MGGKGKVTKKPREINKGGEEQDTTMKVKIGI